jgi:hypothetical protein
MTVRAKVAVAASAVAWGVAIGAVGALLEDREPWPPDWYVDRATNPAQHKALWRRAIATPATEFPPTAATLAYLRNTAVSAASHPGERLDEALVYSGNGYTLQLRGKFSTAHIGPAPQGWKPARRFCPCLTYGLDAQRHERVSRQLRRPLIPG